MTSPDPIDLLHNLVSIPSVSHNEAQAAAFLCDWLRSHNLDARIQDNNVLCAIHGDSPGPTFLLNSHTDTVPAKDGWNSDPWSPFITEDGFLVGLGSGDAKGSLSAMATALVEVSKKGLPCGTLLFAATCLEEVGRGGMDTLFPTLPNIDAALVGEPTNLQPAVAQGGLLILEATTHGKTAHSARAHLGINALTIAARDLLKIDALVLDRVHPFLGTSSANVTVIQGGDRHNVIPDACNYTIDIRYTPAYTAEELTAHIDDLLEASIHVRSNRLRPVETPQNGPLLNAFLKARPDSIPFGSPTMSDWVHLHNTPAIKVGPGTSQKSHTPNESVSIAEVRQAVTMYADTVCAFLDAHTEQQEGTP